MTTRWLDEDEQRSWRAFMWGSRLLMEALDRQLQRDEGLPHAYYMILSALSEAPGRTLTMSELAQTVRGSASRLSHAVARLEEAGLVRRERHRSDKRTTMAMLTEEGVAKVVAAAPGHVEAVRNLLFDRLTPEQGEQLGLIFRTVLGGLDDLDAPARRWSGERVAAVGGDDLAGGEQGHEGTDDHDRPR
ncbi:hypothetical protein Afil01_36120 [Actinorhabdospora filicis]|uniref:HTH marR-type domain-containing protein n=1 Tax=Actinorhabdospora filicis TaxID=1785913 RepID=A0A9W6SKR8_9ACTN|nr:hypothetical protein Afil01_36120 [Actinorhabdospora filicis]